VRNVVLGLILANLGVWAWLHWILPQPEQPSRYDGPSITLFDELDLDALARAALAADAASSGDLSVRWSAVTRRANDAVDAAERDHCIDLGPFTDSDDIDAAIETLTAAGYAPTATQGAAEIWDGYWIYLRSIPDMDTARDHLARLKDAGLDDAYIIPDSDSGILISLGVFVEESRAAAQLDRVNSLGFEATVADRTSQGEATWLELDVAEDELDSFSSLRHPSNAGFLERRDCAAGSD
jgi:hypothetical protein